MNAPVRQASLREHNLRVVLNEIVEGAGPPSRAEIASRTGLTKATVSSLADQLIGAGLVSELPVIRSQRAGRPAAPLVPARATLAGIGMEINVDYLGLRALDMSGAVLIEKVVQKDLRGSQPRQVIDELASMFAESAALLAARSIPMVGCHLALPGLVDTETGPLRLAPNLGWHDVDVVRELRRHPAFAGVTIRLANEATVAARAEADALRGGGLLSFFYVSGEIGIGGAIITDGEVWPGGRGFSGEIGHTVVDPNGPPCSCGATGCLEQYAGQEALLADSGLPAGGPIATLVDAAPTSVRVRSSLRKAGRALGVALSNAVNLIDVDTVILGGIYAPLIDYLRVDIVDQLSVRVLSGPWSPVAVRAATVTDYAALTGGALAVLAGIRSNPSDWISRAH